jgi:hypothetical protein
MSDSSNDTKAKPWYDRARAGELLPYNYNGAAQAEAPVAELAEKLAAEFRRSRASVVTLDLNVSHLSDPVARATLRQAAALCGVHPDGVILVYDPDTRIMRMAHRPL